MTLAEWWSQQWTVRHEFLHRQDRIAQRARLRRRGFPIRAYVGANGSGKSLFAVYDLLPSLEFGRQVLSTVRLLDYRNPRPCEDPTCTYPGHPEHGAAHPLWVPFKDYQQLLDARDTDIFMDEVTGVASSRESQSMPVQVANQLVQLRRKNNTLSWTTPNYRRADVIIRECTQAVTLCTGFLPRARPAAPGEPPRLWADRTAFVARTYDAMMIDDFDMRAADVNELPPLARQILWRPGGYAMRAYETLDPVLALGWANEAGMCMVCGGRRTVPRCGCGEGAPREPKRRAATATPEGSGASTSEEAPWAALPPLAARAQSHA